MRARGERGASLSSVPLASGTADSPPRPKERERSTLIKAGPRGVVWAHLIFWFDPNSHSTAKLKSVELWEHAVQMRLKCRVSSLKIPSWKRTKEMKSGWCLELQRVPGLATPNPSSSWGPFLSDIAAKRSLLSLHSMGLMDMWGRFNVCSFLKNKTPQQCRFCQKPQPVLFGHQSTSCSRFIVAAEQVHRLRLNEEESEACLLRTGLESFEIGSRPEAVIFIVQNDWVRLLDHWVGTIFLQRSKWCCQWRKRSPGSLGVS